jgi:hypothetical protein
MFSKDLKSNFLSEVNILGLVVANAAKIGIAASLGFLISGYAVLKENVKTLSNRKSKQVYKHMFFIKTVPFSKCRVNVFIDTQN